MWFKNELSAVFTFWSAFTLLSSEKSAFLQCISLCPLEKMLLFLDCFPSAKFGLYFVCLRVFVLFHFFILVVSSQLVTTKNADIGILLMCFCSVVLPQQFEKLKQTNPSNCVSKVLEFNNLMQKSR